MAAAVATCSEDNVLKATVANTAGGMAASGMPPRKAADAAILDLGATCGQGGVILMSQDGAGIFNTWIMATSMLDGVTEPVMRS